MSVITNSVNFADIDHASLRSLLGARCYGKAGLEINAAPQNVKITAAVDYSIDGVMYTLAVTAAINLSAATVINEAGETITMTAQATAKDRIYLLVVNAAGTIKVVQGTAVATGATCPCPGVPSGYCAFGAVKVANASGSPFTFGTTSLATAGVTDTYYDLAIAPDSL